MLRLTFTLNGRRRTVSVEGRTTLLEVLRESFLLTGSKEACGVGECGNCMVLVDEQATPSCLVLAADARDRDVVTIEGIAADGTLDVVQQAFIDAGAFQCGFCTPGMVITAKALLDENPAAEPEEIKQELSGVLCRCGSYTKIMAAFDALTGRGS